MSTAPPPVDTRAGFQQALRWGLAAAIGRGARRIVCSDPDFAAWPLDDAALHEQLMAWLRLPQRRLVLFAASYDAMPRLHPRFVTWRTPWIHAVEAWAPAEGDAAEVPRVLVDDGDVFVHLRDAENWLGRAGRDAAQAQRWRDVLDARIAGAESSFAPRPLGL
ncbi:hypothetical protein [Rubrivivax gelatinosus]|uniref:hypothetical protein n=1 Tax=Rubrivivax gelatinosus TaxID=28068 RepID=UPI001F5B4501|nr:hypothetical protein [Rubrivivax gelatinosus]